MGVNYGHPPRRLIEDNNTPPLIRTQTGEMPAKSVCRVCVCVCVCVIEHRHAHAYVNVTAWGLAYPHICIIPVCSGLGERTWIKLHRVVCSCVSVLGLRPSEAEFVDWLHHSGVMDYSNSKAPPNVSFHPWPPGGSFPARHIPWFIAFRRQTVMAMRKCQKNLFLNATT